VTDVFPSIHNAFHALEINNATAKYKIKIYNLKNMKFLFLGQTPWKLDIFYAESCAQVPISR
jgi:hypothetical protein